MDAEALTRSISISSAPRKMRCPTCGTLGRRVRMRERKVRSIEFKRVLWLDVTYAEYVAKCDCCHSFHSCPEGIEPRAEYDNKVRQAVIDRILKDKLNLSKIQECMQRDFLLNLSTGYIYSALEYAIKQFDGHAFRQLVLTEFSGTLCVDEIHLGSRVVLIATDPIADNPIACALVSRNDALHMQRFLQNLKNHGFDPKIVTTDRSLLYPATIQKIWPNSKHQLCVFHVMADVNECVLDGVREIRRSIVPKSRKKRKRGRPKNRQKAKMKMLAERKRQADLIFRNRFLLVRKPSTLDISERNTLDELFAIEPQLKKFRKFTVDLHQLFSLRRTEKKAWALWRRMKRNRMYLQTPALARALKILSKETMMKLLVYLGEVPLIRAKVRTNNHVERTNRQVRYLEKVRYKWRRPKTIVRHILLQFQVWLENKQIAREKAALGKK